MKFIKYGKYVGEPADAVDLEELVKRLGDFFLQSGFESQFYGLNEMDPEKSMEALRQAILRALQEGDLLPEGAMSEEMREMLQNADAMNNEAIRDLIDKITERMANEGFINPQQPPQVTREHIELLEIRIGDDKLVCLREQNVVVTLEQKTLKGLNGLAQPVVIEAFQAMHRDIVRGLKAEADLALFDPKHNDLEQDVEAVGSADHDDFLAFPCQNQHERTPSS